MQPEGTTMVVALPLFGYKLPQMYIDMTILHDSTTWYMLHIQIHNNSSSRRIDTLPSVL